MSWGRRYGRPVRLGKNPTRPKTRILAAGDDACRLLERLHRHGSGYRPGLQAEALRQIIVQNYYRDAAGRLRWRTADDGGLPPSSSAIISPYDTTARYVRHGHIISWKGFAADHCPAPHPPAPQERRRVRGLRSSGEPGWGQADGARLGLAPSCQACAAAAVNAACTPWAWSA